MPGPRHKYTPEKKAARKIRAERFQSLMDATPSSQNLIDLSLFVREIVDQTSRVDETRLVNTCWVEYAYMSPVKRTAAFTSEYLKVYRRFYGKYFDHNRAPYQCPIDEIWAANEPAEMVALWHARQHADERGIPYTIFLGEALEFAASKGFKKFPRPNQLYSGPVLPHIEAYWAEHRDHERLRLEDWDTRFQLINYAGDPAQRRLHQIVVERALRKPLLLDINIKETVLSERAVLPISVAVEHFGDAPVQAEIKRARELPQQPPAGATARYVTPCIGVAYNLDPVACGACSVSIQCGKVSAHVDRKSLESHGLEEPKRAAKKEAARLRQQRRRARLRGDV